MAGSVWQQQAFALDVRLNAHRVAKHANLRTLYIRRRNQLLRENSATTSDQLRNDQLRKTYIKIRSHLLTQRYNVSLDTMSVNSKSRSVHSVPSTPDLSATNIWNEQVLSENEVVPTSQAEASRAIVGDTSISENYAFAGVHHIFDQHTDEVSMIKFAHNDRARLCAVSHDCTMSVCNVATSPPHVEFVFQGHSRPVTGCDWSASNDLIATCSLDGSVRLWSVQDRVCLRRVTELTGHPVFSCLFHPVNNNLLLTGSSAGMVAVVNVSTGIYVKGGSCKVGGTVLSIAGEASGQGVIVSILCDDLGRLSKGKRLVLSQDCPITCLSWRSWISREARDPTLLVNIAANAVCILKVLDKEGAVQLKRKFNVNHKSSKYQVRSTFCPIMSFREGACVVTGSEDSCVYFLDIQSKEHKNAVNKLQGHACPVLGVSFNYDESLLATSDYQGLIILWSREKHEP
ncbi:hypothetical protein M8J75_003907 [Diaphorina citri]|nr:hypothetical protein M8J75_003907 [Diaphorina citri]